MDNFINKIDGTLCLNTSAGKLKVIPDADTNFPGFKIYLNGTLVTRTEVITENNLVRTIAYNESQDEPVNISNFNRG